MQAQIQNDPIINFPSLYKYGMVLSRVSNTVLNVSAGACRDSNNVIDIVLGSANVEGSVVAAPLALNFAVNGVNGLDTGVVADSTMYAVYMIADSRYYLPTACIATLSTNSLPLIPNGYDSHRLIGFWGIDATGILQFGYYFGKSNDMTFYYASQEETNVLITGVASIDLSRLGLVPSIDDVQVGLQVSFTGLTAGNTLKLNNGFNEGLPFIVVYTQVASVVNSEQVTLMTGPLVGGKPTVVFGIPGAGDTGIMYVLSFTVSL